MKDSATEDIFSLFEPEPEPDYGESEPVIAYNKNLNRMHSEDTVYFMEGSRVFHHITDRADTLNRLTSVPDDSADNSTVRKLA